MDHLARYSLPDYLNQLYQSGASNAWVISGNHTTTGKPILANDPHLGIKIPSTWYQASLRFFEAGNTQSQKFIQGGSMPSLPAILIAQTNYLAFGVTTLYTDTTDLMVETIVGDKYLYEGKYIPLKYHSEQIKIKGQPTNYTHTVPETHHGPVFRAGEFDAFVKQDVSFMWPGYAKNDTLFDGMFRLYRAGNLAEIKQALDLCTGPPQAAVWYTQDGHIGFVGNGRLPVRRKLSTMGVLNNGSLAENEWLRYVTPAEQPFLVDPKKGYIVVANNNFATQNYKNHINLNQFATSRSLRITQMIESFISQGKKISVRDVEEMQNDVYDAYSGEYLKNLIRLYEKHKETFYSASDILNLNNYIRVLQSWDHEMSRDSIGASIFQLWEHEYSKHYFADKFPDASVRAKIFLDKNQ